MINKNTILKIPKSSILGINYSGMHDSSIAIVGPNGVPIYAMSLERVSRFKQDGRPPDLLLKNLNWRNIIAVATTTKKFLKVSNNKKSNLHPISIKRPSENYLRHNNQFRQYFERLKKPVFYFCHEKSHAHSAFWASGFKESICLVYDGGMANCQWFGGIYYCSRKTGIKSLDLFDSQTNAKITSLYSVVTAILGFTPNKHEGKLTGLAAFGTPSRKAFKILKNWFYNDYLELESAIKWEFAYENEIPPLLFVNQEKIKRLREAIISIRPADIAATLQKFAEDHVLDILVKAKQKGHWSEKICLAGGLFANVKINQKVLDFGFKEIFVAPPMTDDGTALGAAWAFLQMQNKPIKLKENLTMYLGENYNLKNVKKTLKDFNIVYEVLKRPAESIAKLLKNNLLIAVHQGKCEFGPRALGNRSILAAANNSRVNRKLNNKLKRTDFMPFAPIIRIEDSESCFHNSRSIKKTAQFMTITANCKSNFVQKCPAVVHQDGTARPQFVTKKGNPIIYDILTEYKKITNLPALINTSLNIHEEPITCSVEDSLRTVFWAGIDCLLLEGKILVRYKKNSLQALNLIQKTDLFMGKNKNFLASAIKIKNQNIQSFERSCFLKEKIIQQKEKALKRLNALAEEKETAIQSKEKILISALKESQEKEEEIQRLLLQIKAWNISGVVFWPLQKLILKILKIKKKITTIRLGKLRQHSPQVLNFPEKMKKRIRNKPFTISIVTPSFNQGVFLEKTIKSVLTQKYPSLEYIIQDGGSTDNSVDIIKKYDSQLHRWESVPDRGQAHAINLGFLKSSGEIMAWINGDDIYTPGALWEVAHFFHTNSHVDVIYGNRLIIDQNDKKIGSWIMPPHDDQILAWADYIPQETLFWRRKLWEKIGGKLDETFHFALDWDLLQRFRMANATMVRLPTFLGCFRVHASQKTSLELGSRGKQEMNILRARAHGRVPSDVEIWENTKKYLRRSIYSNFTHDFTNGIRKIISRGKRNTFYP